ncbi:HNH endonuclease [Verrucosispora sp. NA02020]|uniref:HNH endonuclease n=1 Tax=Verrucosispora sp. NA02020 TaxID=2742132 RepID=UPI001C37D009|nr:HNH endonuclease [Verrucosispora sp. NA02020]
MAVSRTLRFQILRRDKHTCQSCGRTAPEVKLEVDHVTPEALGGATVPENLRTLCADCNGGKSATPPDAAVVAQVSDDAVRWAEAMKVAANRMLADRERRARVHEEFDQAWHRWTGASDKQPLPRDADWQDSIDRLLAAGLPMPILSDCIDQAMRNKTIPADRIFRYMCGIAWKRVKELHSGASGLTQVDAPNSSPGGPIRALSDLVLGWADDQGRGQYMEEAKRELAEEGACSDPDAVHARAAFIGVVDLWHTKEAWAHAARSVMRGMPRHLLDRLYGQARDDALRAQARDAEDASGEEFKEEFKSDMRADEEFQSSALRLLGREIGQLSSSAANGRGD